MLVPKEYSFSGFVTNDPSFLSEHENLNVKGFCEFVINGVF